MGLNIGSGITIESGIQITPILGIVTTNLTLYLDPAQTASYSGTGTTWSDISGNGNNETLVGGPTYATKYFSFNGSTQYATGSGTPLGQTAYTKSFWFNLASYTGNNNTVSGDAQFSYFSGGNRLQNGHTSWPNFGAFTSVTVFALNTWYNACVTFNTATGMALYVNGALDSTYVSTSTNPTNVAVGGTGRVDIAQFGGSNLLTGSIGQVLVYNRDLTANEALQNFLVTRATYGV